MIAKYSSISFLFLLSNCATVNKVEQEIEIVTLEVSRQIIEDELEELEKEKKK